MTGFGWVSLIALVGWLILALGSYRAHRIGAGRTMVMAAAWVGIFLLIAWLFVVVG